MAMKRIEPVRLAEKLAAFTEQWAPRVVAELNDYQFKVARLEGEFVWHAHNDTDEAFLVLDGELTIELRDGAVAMRAGDLYVVPRGVEHRPRAERECQVLLIEPRGVVNTGDSDARRASPNDVWV